MTYLLSILMVFLSGFVVAINLACLWGMPPSYEASWGKVGTAIIIGIIFTILGGQYNGRT